jgi:acyl carrier protein
MPDHQPSSPFFQKDAESLRHELRGLPAWGVEAALRYQATQGVEDFTEAVLGVIEFYLPRAPEKELRHLPDATDLRQDLDVDSLSMTEAAFKLEEVFGMPVDVRELAAIHTLGDMRGYFAKKLLAPAS